jgi:Flp pilus assembly protein TadD
MRLEGLAMIRRALDANPNNVVVLNQAGICNMIGGDLDEAEACFRRAYQLSPGAPEVHESLAGVGFSRFFKRDFEVAVDWLNRSRATQVEWPPVYWILAAAYSHLDRIDEARAVLDELRTLVPGASIAAISTQAPRFAGRFDIALEGLRKAGFD